MIQYALKCGDGHTFDSWFQSAAAFDKLVATGLVSCVVCGSDTVAKAIMTPRVRPGRKAVSGRGEPEAQPSDNAVSSGATQAFDRAKPQGPRTGLLSTPANAAEQALAEFRRKVEDSSDYVGKDFVAEARAMHDGDAPERAIYGEAKLDDAKALIEEGISVLPLPFLPHRKIN
ncbi:MAG: hypothetical protein COB16_05240 [Rhodobacteraceae bacterium]|nr:MAG: hypothetical protein COB16_05240 [Paracoccaceae bacterium]